MNTLEVLKQSVITPSSASHRAISQTFVVNIHTGLHARPCASLVKALRPFQCQVEVQANGVTANGHSIMSLMVLAAAYGTKVKFAMIGRDAAPAMAAVHHLFETHFEEAYAGSGTKPLNAKLPSAAATK